MIASLRHGNGAATEFEVEDPPPPILYVPGPDGIVKWELRSVLPTFGVAAYTKFQPVTDATCEMQRCSEFGDPV